MDLSKLKPAEGSVRKRKRIARGQGSGRGGTSTRGHKGQQSRSGYSRKFGFEGGQMPLQRKVPKRGFKNINRKEFVGVNLSRLQALIEKHEVAVVDIDVLRKHRIISKSEKVKILGHGELKTKVDLQVNAISASARKAVEDLGGTITIL